MLTLQYIRNLLCCSAVSFLCTPAGTATVHLGNHDSICLSVCPFVRLSHGWISQKWCAL